MRPGGKAVYHPEAWSYLTHSKYTSLHVATILRLTIQARCSYQRHSWDRRSSVAPVFAGASLCDGNRLKGE